MRNWAKPTINKLEQTIKITGLSDDIISLEGDISEEFYNDGYLEFSDGTVIKCKYDDDGIWRFDLHIKGNAECDIEFAEENDGFPDSHYTDTVILTGFFTYVKFWNDIENKRADLIGILSEDIDYGEFSTKVLEEVYSMLLGAS